MPTVLCEEARVRIPLAADTRPPVWLIGSGMAVPSGDCAGVPGTEEMARRIVDAFPSLSDDHPAAPRVEQIKRKIQHGTSLNWPDLYQDACAAIQDIDNRILDKTIRRAVLEATTDAPRLLESLDVEETGALSDATGSPQIHRRPGFRVTNAQANAPIDWDVRDGLHALARIVRTHPTRRGGHVVVTTNFDPLISIAFNLAGTQHARFTTDDDFPIEMIETSLPLVAHVHGYWLGPAKMLNLKDEISRDVRLSLRSSLTRVFKERTVVVAGYGGWDDVVMGALSEALATRCTVIWLEHRPDPEGARFRELCGRLHIRAQSTRDFFYVPGLDVDAFLEDIANHIEKTCPSNEESNVASENQRLRREVDRLNHELAEKRSHREHLEGMAHRLTAIETGQAKLTADISILRDRTTTALATIVASSEFFSKTTIGWRQDFDEHRGNQTSRLERIEKNGDEVLKAATGARASRLASFVQTLIVAAVLTPLIVVALKTLGIVH